MSRSRSLSVVLCLSLLSTMPAVAQNCDGWVPIGPPALRSTPFFAYDSNASRVLMFGGTNEVSFDPGKFHEDVWFVQDGQWRWVPDSSDITKAAHGGMAFDAQRNVFVIVREGHGNGQLGGTWEFDGTTWVQRAPIAQTPTGVNLVYDPLAQNVVAYGFNLVQRWDGTSWQTDAAMQAGIGPERQVIAWDASAGGFVSIPSMSFSQNGPTRLYRNQTWTQIAPISPPGYCDMTFDPTRGTVVAMRTDSVIPFETSIFELRDGAWRRIPNSSLNDMVLRRLYFDVRSQSLMVVGSGAFSSMGLSPTIYRFGGSGWVPLDDQVGPEYSVNPMMAYDTDRQRMIFAGGSAIMASVIDRSTWELRGDTWRRRGDVPRFFSGDAGYPGFDAGATYDPVLRRIVGTSNIDQSVEFDGTAWIRRGSSSSTGSPRLPRWDASRQRVVGGGFVGFALYNPSGTNVWSPFSIAGIATSSGVDVQQLAVDPSANRLLALTNTQTLSIVGNTLASAFALPVFRPGPMAFDPVRGGFVLFSGASAPRPGGGSINVPAKTYFLPQGGSSWQELPVRGPIGRIAAELEWDPDAQRLVLSTGSLGLSSTPAFGFWKLAQGPAGIAVPPVATTVNARESVELFTIAKGGGVLNYTWRRNGQVITNSPNIRGATTDTLLLLRATLADAGEYTVTVTNPCGTETSQPVTLTVNPILCDSIDFNRDEVFPEEQDVIDFFLVLAGGECPYTPPSGEACDIDFNNNQVFPEEQDVIDFFNVLAGETC
jgi:hypothetical protein